jgi:type VI secretion system protein ImpM
MIMSAVAEVGLFGKLPTRGDFLQLGLPGSFVRPWDAWLQRAMAASQQQMGDTWLPAFLESPIWRFQLPAGMCGAGAVLGLLMPSVDRVGRYFPLTLAAVFPPGGVVPPSDIADSWLEACETLARTALDDDVPPDQLTQRLPSLSAGASTDAQTSADAQTVAAGCGEWWTDGGPRVAAMRLALAVLPDAAQFADMLGAGQDAGLDTVALTREAP